MDLRQQKHDKIEICASSLSFYVYVSIPPP